MEKHVPSFSEGQEDEGCPPSTIVASLGAAEGDLRERRFKVRKNCDKCMRQGDVGSGDGDRKTRSCLGTQPDVSLSLGVRLCIVGLN
jgi:hypothetical protein